MKKFIRKNRSILILYLIVEIFAISALVAGYLKIDDSDNIVDTLQGIGNDFVSNLNPFSSFGTIFSNNNGISSYFEATIWWTCIFIALWIFYLIKNSKKHEYDKKEHGSSDWAKYGEEFDKLRDGSEALNKRNGFILSKDHYLGTDQKKVKLNKNILVIGGSGTGKSACYVKPNLLQKLGSYVVTDPKGELYRETSGYLKNNGYEVQVLNLIETDYSNRYNPLSHISNHNDVSIIAETIIKSGKSESTSADPFWDNTATMLLKACIYYVISVLPEEERNLSSCLNIIRSGGSDETILDRLFVDELKPAHPGRKEYESIRLAADKTKQSIAITVASKLKDFDSPNIQKVTTSNEFDFSKIGKKKMAIYVITPPDHSTYDYIMTVFFSQMFQILFNDAYKLGGTLSNPVYFLLDEFANIGQIPAFEKKLSTTRSYGISVSIIIQALDQLEGLYKEQYQTIIGNCDTQIFLGSQSIKTCEYISKSLGQKTIKFRSKSVNKDKNEITKQGVSLSEQRQGRDLMTIDEVKRLDPNEEIILVRGVKPIKAKKAWYFKYHPEKDRLRSFEITDLNSTPKPEEREIKTFDVEQHLDLRKQVSKEKEIKNENQSVDESEEVDLKKELEKKFDELFGDDE